jgi:hypothetical protein
MIVTNSISVMIFKALLLLPLLLLPGRVLYQHKHATLSSK